MREEGSGGEIVSCTHLSTAGPGTGQKSQAVFLPRKPRKGRQPPHPKAPTGQVPPQERAARTSAVSIPSGEPDSKSTGASATADTSSEYGSTTTSPACWSTTVDDLTILTADFTILFPFTDALPFPRVFHSTSVHR